MFYTIACSQIKCCHAHNTHYCLIIVSPLLLHSTSIVCDLSDERPKEEKLSFKEVKEQRTNEQVAKEDEVGEKDEDRSEDLGNRWKKNGYGGAGRGEEELLVSREDEQERMKQEKENLALESIWKKATRYWPKLVS